MLGLFKVLGWLRVHFVSPARLRELGVLGLNERNVACISAHNPRRSFPSVDDKFRPNCWRKIMGLRPRLYWVLSVIRPKLLGLKGICRRGVALLLSLPRAAVGRVSW